MKLHPKQAAVLRDIFSRNGSRVVNRCANEVGKTRRVLCASILYAIEIRGAVVVSTAGVFRQIKDQLMPALKAYAHLFDPALWDFQDCAIKRFDRKNRTWTDAYTGVSTKDEHYFQGYHKDEKRPLYIAIDECQGVSVQICNAAEDRCNPTWFLATGSPGDPQGAFYEMETSKASFYTHHKLMRMECLKEDGWWLDRAEIERVIAKSGENSQFVQSTVFGNFATAVEGALITLGEYDLCLENPPAFMGGEMHGFNDFAAGRDKNVYALRRGNLVTIRRAWQELNTMTAVGQFVQLFTADRKEHGLRPEDLSGDADGLGLPMIHRLRELDWPVFEFHGGAEERFNNGYRNKIAEAWGEGIGKIKRCAVILPPDLDLKAQILGRKGKPNSSGMLEIEKKEDYKKRTGFSPDEADAVFGCMMPRPQVGTVNLIQQAQEMAAQTDWSGGNADDGERRFF